MRNRLTILLIVSLMIAVGIQNVSSQTRITNALLALYEFNEQSGDVVHDTSGNQAPLNLTIENLGRTTWGAGTLSVDRSTIIKSDGPAIKLIDGIMATNQLTFEAWITAANVTQIGPARVMTLSQDTNNRNATLGQASNSDDPTAYNGRVRSSTTSNNGIPALDTPSNLASTSLKHVVMTRDVSGLIRIYVDGKMVAERNNGGDLSNWNTNYAFGLAREVSGERPWIGTYHLVAVYNRALTSSEVQQNFNAGPNDDLGPVNLPPTANAGSDQTVVDTDHNGMASVTLDGSASINPEGGAMRYVWDSNRVHIPNEAVVTTDFPVGTTEVTLTVIDLADGAQDTDTMIVTVVPASGLTLFTFDEELEEIEPDHWVADGISFENGSVQGVWCAEELHLCGPHIEGAAVVGVSSSTLTIMFDEPTTIFGFGIAITLDALEYPEYQPWDDVFILDLYGPGQGEFLETRIVAASPVSEFWMDAYVSYIGPAVKTIAFHVAPQYYNSGWAIDNIVYEENPENLSPIADAGNDQIVVDNDNNGVESITLDGSASFDPEGGILRYVWSASGVTIPEGAVVSADLPVGMTEVTLTVIDPEGAQDTDTVLITVEAGSTQGELTTITFEGLPSEVFTSLYVHGAEFDMPDLGTYGNILYDINNHTHGIDGLHYIENMAIWGEVIPWNITFDDPTTVVEFGFAMLDGFDQPIFVDLYGPGPDDLIETIPLTFSEPDHDWRNTYFSYSGPAVKHLTLRFGGTDLQTTDYYLDNITFLRDLAATINDPPIADAGPDQIVYDNDSSGWEWVTFDGSASSDSDGSIVSYKWITHAQVIGTGVSPAFQLGIGTTDVTLVATDNYGAYSVDTVTITVESGGPSTGRVTNGLLTLYEFNEQSGDVVHDTSGSGTPMNLTIENLGRTTWGIGTLSVDRSTIIKSDGPAIKLIDGIVATNELTFEAWVTAANVTQIGPARIMTLSQDTSNRNATLGQASNTDQPTAYNGRVRSTTTSNNGTPVLDTPPNLATTSLKHVVMTRDISGFIRIYVDGTLVAERNNGGDLSNWNHSYNFGLAREVSGERPWIGTFHLVAVYNRALSGNQVQQNFNAGPNDDLGPVNSPPLASAGPDQTVVDNDNNGVESVTLDGTASVDPEGGVLRYVWSASGVTIPEGAVVSADFPVGMTEVTLTVIDPEGAQDTDPVLITVQSGSFSCASVTQIPTAECEALVALYNSTDGDNWINNDGWLQTNTPCSWNGIDCEDNGVIHIFLWGNHLSGPIPPSIGNLKNLRGLYIHTNQLSGQIPSEIGNLTVLRDCNLANNQLEGAIPQALLNLSEAGLQELYLQGNALDEFPIGIPNPGPHYWDIKIDYNKIEITDPDVITFLENSYAGDWWQTQTIQPSDVHVTDSTAGSVTLAWTPIPYVEDGGYYEVRYATQSGDAGQVGCQTQDKTESGCVVSGLTSNTTYYFTVQTYTPAHPDNPENNLWSRPSDEVVGSTFTQVNMPPVANAGSDQTIVDTDNSGSESVTLNGSASTDSDGTIVIYSWNESGSEIASGISPTIELAVGVHNITLIITDDDGATGFDTVVIKVDTVSSGPDRVTDGLLALYEFNESGGNLVTDTGGYRTPLNLTISNTNNTTWSTGSLTINQSTVIQSSGPATKIIDAVRSSNEVTLEAWIQSNDLTQSGPARVAGISGDPSNRNITLGQGLWSTLPLDVYDMRLRTRTTGHNGVPSVSTPAGSATTNLTHVLLTHAVDGTSTIYVNGVALASGNQGTDLGNWDTAFPMVLANEPTGDRPWRGTFHLVAVYDRALTSAEVMQNFAAGADGGTGGPTNLPPLANAGVDQIVIDNDNNGTESVTLDGSASVDPEGDVLRYVWSASGVTIPEGAVVSADFPVGMTEVTLTVIDPEGAQATDAVLITVESGSFSCASVTQIPTAECEALVALYNSTNGDNWLNNDGWLQTNTPCSWYGITCNGGHVSGRLELPGNNLSGTLPPEIGNLPYLLELSFGGNNIGGQLPAALGNMNISYLHLGGNQFTGPIPAEIGNMSHLRFLALSTNELSGQIPSELANLTNLEDCHLEDNHLEGAIPQEIGNMSGLETLHLGFNMLESVPSSITNLVDIYWIEIGYNRIEVHDSSVAAFLNDKDWGREWWQSQTIPPSDILITNTTTDSVTFLWTPIPYVEDGGLYEVRYSMQTGGTQQIGCQTLDKTESGCTVTGLMPNTTYYFTVQTFTPAHPINDDSGVLNRNDLWSRPSDEIVASTLTQNLPPLANAGVDQTVVDSDNTGFESVFLDGSASVDPEGGLLRYMWSANGVTIPEGAIVSAEFPVGTTEVTLTVIDPEGAQGTDTVSITVNPGPGNQPPVANAGSDQIIVDTDNSGSESVTLNGSASTDSDGTIVIYSWNESGSEIASGVRPTIELAVGVHNITLIITDDDGATGFDTVVIKVDTGSSGPDRVTDGLLALYEFNENGGNIVTDTSGYGTPMNLTVSNTNNTTWSTGSLTINQSTVIQSSGPATKIIDAVRSSNEVTLEAWIQTNNLNQAGPARVAGISGDPANRNITLGQGLWGTQPLDVYDMRLRTRTTGHNGMPSISTPAGSATTNLTHVVLTHALDGTSKIYVNGVSLANGNQGTVLGNWDTTFPLVLANEPTGDRPWLGTFHLVAFYGRALTGVEVLQNFAAGAD